jgi:hypothetical protein
MKIQYSFHEGRMLCCGKKNQFRASFNYDFHGLPHRITGCGETKSDAKKRLLFEIKNIKSPWKDAIQKQLEN